MRCIYLIAPLILIFIQYVESVRLSQVRFQGCRLNTTNGTTGANTPVILDAGGHELTLAVPQRGSINFNTSANLILVCPGPKNKLVNVNTKDTEATCLTGNTIKISDTYQSFDHIQCTKPVSAEVSDPGGGCGNARGKPLNIGYKLEGYRYQDFVTLISVCYDEDEGIPLYTVHVIHGNALKYAAKSSVRPYFSTLGLGNDVAASVAYKKRFQKSTFNSLLSSTRLADKYINQNSFISTGHLSPHGDFLLTSSQRSSYFYINACPQWQVINNGNWKSLELRIRKTAEAYNKTFVIMTGTYGVLELRDNNNKPTKIYLHKKIKLPVPKYTWKIMYDPEEKEGIAFVVYNNPFGKINENMELEFCENICMESGWEQNNWSNMKKGYLFCCHVQDLISKLGFLPYIQVKDVLRGHI